ncbi:MAG TPA: hypothetical protein VIW45_21715 [Vicinamibacterales bacterium]|jgi:hypothetical protein
MNGEACLSVKKNAKVRLTAVSANGASNPLVFMTPNAVASDADCTDASKCPLVATTHLMRGEFHEDLKGLSSDWCASSCWANGDPAFDVGWRDDLNHLAFSNSEMSLTLNDCDPNKTCPNNTDPAAISLTHPPNTGPSVSMAIAVPGEVPGGERRGTDQQRRATAAQGRTRASCKRF